PVVVDVAHRDAAAVVVVHVGEDIERRVVGQAVGKGDAGALRGEPLEQLRLARAAARERQREGEQRPPGSNPQSAIRNPQLAYYLADRIRIACPPPGASTRCRRVVASTGRLEIETGNGFVSQFAPGPSA